MAKLDWEKTNRTKRLREQGSEYVDGVGLPDDRKHSMEPYRASVSAEESGKSRRIAGTPPAGERERFKRAYERSMRRRADHQAPKDPRTGKALTHFEAAYLGYLRAHARAVVNNSPLPTIPRLIKRRYKGEKLLSWQRGALRTERYASELQAAKKERNKRP